MFFTILICLWLLICRTAATGCLLLAADDYDTYESMESTYLELPGRYSVTDDGYFEIAFEVFPSVFFNAGAMFSLGSPSGFKYYSFRPPQPQYVALEFDHRSLSLLLKSNSTLFYHDLPISKTFPDPYNILDKKWHYVHAFKGPGDRKWKLSIDNIKPVEEEIMPGLTNVTILNELAYFGGRPGYTTQQFQGIIRNVVLNGEWISLYDGRTNGLAEVVDCQSVEAEEFESFILNQYELLMADVGNTRIG